MALILRVYQRKPMKLKINSQFHSTHEYTWIICNLSELMSQYIKLLGKLFWSHSIPLYQH